MSAIGICAFHVGWDFINHRMENSFENYKNQIIFFDFNGNFFYLLVYNFFMELYYGKGKCCLYGIFEVFRSLKMNWIFNNRKYV